MEITIQFREAFARKLIKLRKEQGLTQADVAAGVGIKHRTYAAYEEARASPSIPILQNLATYYGETVDELIDLRKETISESIQRMAKSRQLIEKFQKELGVLSEDDLKGTLSKVKAFGTVEQITMVENEIKNRQ